MTPGVGSQEGAHLVHSYTGAAVTPDELLEEVQRVVNMPNNEGTSSLKSGTEPFGIQNGTEFYGNTEAILANVSTKNIEAQRKRLAENRTLVNENNNLLVEGVEELLGDFTPEPSSLSELDKTAYKLLYEFSESQVSNLLTKQLPFNKKDLLELISGSTPSQDFLQKMSEAIPNFNEDKPIESIIVYMQSIVDEKEDLSSLLSDTKDKLISELSENGDEGVLERAMEWLERLDSQFKIHGKRYKTLVDKMRMDLRSYTVDAQNLQEAMLADSGNLMN